jgi:hypothetical protein
MAGGGAALVLLDSGRFAPLRNAGVLRFAQNDEQKQLQKQIPFGDDKHKGKNKAPCNRY